MGTTVYDCGNPNVMGAHIYCHSRRDGKKGYVYLIINNSLNDTTTVSLPCEAEIYALSGGGDIRSKVMYLNGEPLEITASGELPEIKSVHKIIGAVELAPGTCTFVVI